MHIIELTELQFKNYSNIHSKKNYKQSIEYAKLKCINDYKPLYLGLVDDDNNVHAATLILEKNLKKMKFDINDMLEEVRSKGYFDLSQVQCAVLEANGELSILPKPEYRPITPKDMDIKVSKEGLCSNVIIDGKIMQNNLKNINKDEEWLKKQLKVRGYFETSKILLGTVDVNEKLIIYERNRNINSKDVLE